LEVRLEGILSALDVARGKDIVRDSGCQQYRRLRPQCGKLRPTCLSHGPDTALHPGDTALVRGALC
jgi:hypothetical protein